MKILLLTIMLLSSCGGGGGGDSSTPTPIPTPTDDTKTSSASTLTINVVAAPVNGASCKAYKITKNAKGELISSATSDNGQAIFKDFSHTGSAFFQCTGGQYLDEATGETTSLKSLSAALKLTTITKEYSVTPLTDIAVKIAKSDLNAVISTHNKKVADQFGLDGLDITQVKPIVASNTNPNKYGLVLAALSQMGQNRGGTNNATSLLSVVEAVVADLTDGEISTNTLNDFKTSVINIKSNPKFNFNDIDIVDDLGSDDNTNPEINLASNTVSYIYDGTTPVKPTATITDNSTTTGIVITGNIDKNVGIYVLTYTATDSAGNKAIPQTATITITPKLITITANPASKVYGENNPTFSDDRTTKLLGSDTLSGVLGSSGVNVGTHNITSTLSNSNYLINFVGENKFSISKKAITITANPASKIYGENNPTFSDDRTTKLLGSDTLSGILGSSGVNVGTHDITSTLNNSNYLITFVGDNKFSISKKAITITVNPASKVYGENNPTFSDDRTTKLLGGDSLSGILGSNGVNVGSYDITSTLSNSNYLIAFVGENKFSISKKSITITANVVTKVYGENNPTFSDDRTTKLLGSDTLSGTLGSNGVNVGTHDITSTLNNSNYLIAFVGENKFSISKKAITITANSASKIYGENNPTFSDDRTTKLLGSDTLSGTLGSNGVNVGSYDITSTLNNINYDITFVGENKFSISKKAITVTANPTSKIYGENNPTFSDDRTTKLLGSDTLSGTLGSSGVNVGTHNITSTLSNSNYLIAFVGANKFSISKKAITITANVVTKVYGENNPTFSDDRTTKLLGGDSLSGILGSSGVNVGTHNITSTLSNSNYLITFVGANKFSISKKAITITANSASKIYGTANPSFNHNGASKLLGSDTLSGTLGSSGVNVGTHDITSTLNNSNYLINFVGDNKFSIIPKPVTITADVVTRVYGENNPSSFDHDGTNALLGSDTLIGSLTISVSSRTIVGSYTISSSLTNGNYDIAFDGVNKFSIIPKPVTITANAVSKLQGTGINPALSHNGAARLLSGDTLIGTLGSIGLSTSTAGTYDITSTLRHDNYDISFDGVNKFSINSKPQISITSKTLSYVYDGTTPTIKSTATIATTANATTTGIIITGNIGTDVGDYVLTYTATDSLGNTAIPKIATITITPKAVTVTANPATKVYGGANPAFAYTPVGLVRGDTLSGTLTSNGVNVGTHNITSTLSHSNYDITFIGINKFSITKASQSVFSIDNNQDKTFGDATFTLTTNGGNSSGVISYTSSNATVAIVNANGTITIKSAGTTTITATKAGDNNYHPISATYLLTVNKSTQASLTGLSSQIKTFGDGIFTLAISGGSGSGTISYTSSNATVAIINANGTITIKSAGTTTITATKAGDNNYHPISATYLLTINKSAQTPLTGLSSQIKTFGDGTFTLAISGGSGSGTISYTSSNQAIASISASGEVTILAVGTTTITATKAGDNNHNPTSDSYLLIVTDPSKLQQSTLTISLVQQKTFGDGTFTLTISGGSGSGSISYTSSNATVAIINASGIVTILTAGTTTITTTKADDNNYNAAYVSFIFTIYPSTTTLANATATISNIQLAWSRVVGSSISYKVYYATETIIGFADLATNYHNLPAVLIDDLITEATTVLGLKQDEIYSFVVTVVQNNIESAISNQVTSTLQKPVATTGTINDTGLTFAGNSTGNNSTCNSSITAPQDCHQGRDAKAAAGTLAKLGGGSAGFDFTKLDSSGNILAIQNQKWSAAATSTEALGTKWSCVKDNYTGLIWEVKTNSGPHNATDAYTWYNTDANTNGGDAGSDNNNNNGVGACYGYIAGSTSTYCNTQYFVERVNSVGLCGASDWQLPNIQQLYFIVDYSRIDPSIDIDYFPNTTANNYFWTSTPDASTSDRAWVIGFYDGYDTQDDAPRNYNVRLVRHAP